jgi:uncharacterized phage protein (TIGR01671 family)
MSKSSPDGSSLIPYEITTSPPLRFRAVHHDGRLGFVLNMNFPQSIERQYVDVAILLGTQEDGSFSLRTFDWDYEEWEVLRDCHPPDLYTGCTDKDGNDIYGGDVVVIQSTPECSLSSLHTGKELIFVVVWNKESLLWDLKDATGGYGFFEFWDDQLSSMRVIGNIHNPEALPEEVRRMLND